MSLPRYGVYKNSGVEWLGEVPNHWEIRKFRHVFKESPEKIESEVVGRMLSVSGYRGIEVKEYDDENRRRLDEELVGYRIVRPGQLVVNTMWLNYAGLGVSDYEGHVSPAYRSYWIEPEYNKRFIHHMMRCDSFVRGYTKFLTGVRPNSLQMSRDDLMAFQLLVPPAPEQSAIAAFLDHETAKIDALIAEQEKLIALLAEKRQATISHAVTRGLNPDVPMKDSGVAWLGEVPAHWDILNLKRCLSDTKAGPFGSALTKDMYVSSGYRVYGQEQVIPADFTIGDYYIDSNKFSELSQYSVCAGDILISCVGTFGKIAIVPENIEPGIINPRLLRLRVGNSLSAEYLEIVLRSQIVFEQFSMVSRGGTMDVINIATISNVIIAIPPIQEQAIIISFLRNQIYKFEALVNEAEKACLILKERRSALIAAAVTGQIDVRNYVAEAS